MTTYQKHIGKIGEDIAADYLSNKGYAILTHNYHSRYGEIDLVALDNGIVVFVEVKTRTKTTVGSPEDSVTPEKIERIHDTALLWFQEHPDVPDVWRLDVIAVLIDHHHNLLDLQHYIGVSDD